MKILTLSLLSLAVVSGSAFAATPQPQPCDSSWGACAIGRANPFNEPSIGELQGAYLMDIFYGSQDEMKENQPIIGDGVYGSATNVTPGIGLVVAPGATEVMLRVYSANNLTYTAYPIGHLESPIGSDTTTYYTRQIILNPGVQFAEQPTQSHTQMYCDPGQVFGAEEFINKISDTTYVISGVTPNPITVQVERVKQLAEYPAILGCH